MNKDCEPKIISYFIEAHNLNMQYNCEICDNDACDHYKEWHEKQD